MRDIEAARDLLQDTLAKAWQRCGCYRGESELFPWLKAALRRGAIDRLRSQRAQTALHDDKGNNWREVESALRDNQNAARHERLPQLQQREREAVFKRCAQRFAAHEPRAFELIRWVAEAGLTPRRLPSCCSAARGPRASTSRNAKRSAPVFRRLVPAGDGARRKGGPS